MSTIDDSSRTPERVDSGSTIGPEKMQEETINTTDLFIETLGSQKQRAEIELTSLGIASGSKVEKRAVNDWEAETIETKQPRNSDIEVRKKDDWEAETIDRQKSSSSSSSSSTKALVTYSFSSSASVKATKVALPILQLKEAGVSDEEIKHLERSLSTDPKMSHLMAQISKKNENHVRAKTQFMIPPQKDGRVSVRVAITRDHATTLWFNISKNLGAGGFGSISKIINHNGEVFAAKTGLKSAGETGQKALQHEVRVLRKIQDIPHVVKVKRIIHKTAGEVESVALELCQPLEGRFYTKYPSISSSSTSSSSQVQRASKEERQNYVTKLGSTIAELNARRIFHLDLNPENTMVGDDGDPKLIDFGIASDFSSRKSKKTNLKPGERAEGNPAYWAPENFGDRDGSRTIAISKRLLAQKSEDYAFAVTAYTLLTGRHPPWIQSALDESKGAQFPAVIVMRVLSKTNRDTSSDVQQKIMATLEEHGELGKFIYAMLDPNPSKRKSIAEFTRRFPPPQSSTVMISPSSSSSQAK